MESHPPMSEDTEQPAVEQTAPAAPTFVAGKLRCETVPLEWPLEYEGRTYSTVTVSRPTIAELDEWRDRIAGMKDAGQDVSKERLPMFDVPTAVLEALDPDDEDRVSEVAGRFLPRRFRDDTSTEPAPSNGSSTPST